ncbi:MAG: phosphodiester glycosidase family protein [Bacilli bacterium]|nr:phosphodiester glycosidase family protein [Bacilli bacterium]
MFRKIKNILLFFIITGLFTLFSVNVYAEDTNPYNLTLGTITKYEKQVVSDIIYERLEIAGNDGLKRVAFNAAFDPKSENVAMVIWDGYGPNNQYQKKTVLEIAQDFEATTGRKVYAAVNGDFFIMSYPQDPQYVGKTAHTYMREGKELVYGWDTRLVNFGFNNDGDYQITKGVLQKQKVYVLRIHFDNGSYRDFVIDKIDKMTLKDEIGIYMPNKEITGNFAGKYLAKLNQTSINYPFEATIVRDENQKLLTNEVIVVPEGHIGIAVNSFGEMINSNAQYFYEYLQHGQRIEVLEQERYTNAGYKNLNNVIGGGERLVINRQVTPFGTTVAVGPTVRHPRTTLGVTIDGKFFIQVIDGRQEGYSEGLTTKDQAQLAFDMGAKDAIELDGGGSSTFILRINDELVVVNRPSDGELRPVGNAVIFVEAVKPPRLPVAKPNCEAFPHLDACAIDKPDDDNDEKPIPTDPIPQKPSDNENKIRNRRYFIYIYGGLACVLIGSVVTVVILRRKGK